MMTQEFLANLHNRDVKLWVEDDRLRINAPKGAITPALRAELAERKGEIIAYLLTADGVTFESIPPLRPIPRDQNLPLSFAQQRLWFFEQLVPGSSVYNIPAGTRFQAEIKVAALEQSLNEMVKRHEALRTTFAIIEGQPVQRILPPMPCPLSIIDLRQLPEAEREAEARRLATKEAQRPFDLSQGPFLRAVLLHLAAQEHLLLLTMHHIASDGWSIGVLIRELSTLYATFTQGQPSPLPDLPIQYADFAHWQRRWLQGKVLEAQLNYWKQHLHGSLPVLELPTDHPRPAAQTFHGANQSFALSNSLFEALRILSQKEGCTLFMTLLAAFTTLLYRYTGQKDIVLGTPVANRNRLEIENLIGFFVNTLVLRTNLSGNPNFRELLKRVHEVALGAYAHQDLPFEILVETLQPGRDAARSPLFQVLFVHEKVMLTPMGTDNGTSKYDLSLFMWEESDRLIGMVEYNTDLFEAVTINRMIGHLQMLLTAIVANPDQGINELPLLAASERQQMLLDWNQTQAEYPQVQSLQQLIEAEVERTPDAVAVVFEGESLTYEELNRQANQLAHYLQKLGVGPDVLVGIYLERSVKMIVALLGVLKAGGAYVPLDPIFPPDRLAYMLVDSQAKVLLTEKHLQATIPAHQAKVVCIDTDWTAIARESQENLDSGVAPANLAYVIYTSGSTGKPKGVQVEHRGVINFLTSMRQRPGLTNKDVLLSVTTLSFDISVLEIFLSLTSGARLVLVSRATAADGLQLMTELHNSGTTVMQATPTTWRMLVEAGWLGKQDLKILCGGEAFPRSLANLLLDRCSQLWNMYGPTETTIWSTIHQVQPGENAVSIGRPIANTLCYALDTHLQPVPVGIPGELYIGGDGLARGYLNRPGLTAEKFIPNPFGNKSSSRLYRTGDLVRYSPNGQIEFLNRIDHQIKLRGFRIELGEIETGLTQHPDIREAVVVVREDSPGNHRLIGYLIGNNKELPGSNEIRLYLRGKLPHYMIPDMFIFLDEFPLTPNKKVDRKALPVPDQVRQISESNYVEPRTQVEEELVKIWCELIQLERVGIHDNFFEVGGHSLLITQILTHVQRSFAVNLPLRSLFEHQTIAELAATIENERNAIAVSPNEQGNKDNLNHLLRLLGDF